jgi:hypothetical protein
MCCGRTRHVAASPRLGSSRRDGELFTYLGRTALTVTGPATGLVYRFAAPGARVRVDARDAIALRRIPVLQVVGSGQ